MAPAVAGYSSATSYTVPQSYAAASMPTAMYGQPLAIAAVPGKAVALPYAYQTSAIPLGASAAIALSRPQSITKINDVTTINAKPIVETPKVKPQSTAAKPAMPSSLKKFIEEAFSSCQTPEDRGFVTDELKNIIARVSADSRLNVHRWELEPFPVLPSKIAQLKLEQQQQLAATAPGSRLMKINEEGFNRIGEDATGSVKRKSRFAEMEPEKKLKIPTSIGGPVISPLPSPSPAVHVSSSITGFVSTAEEVRMRELRASRFLPVTEPIKSKKKQQKVITVGPEVTIDRTGEIVGELDFEKLKVVGTSSAMEKDYFRLTSPPDPSTVRPEKILKKAIVALRKKLRNNEVEYIYVCSQLKAMRQDLTVQHIRNGE